MINASLHSQENNIYVAGELTFESVSELVKQGLLLIEKKNNISVDLRDVTLCNSAGLALLIEWLSHAHKLNKTISFNNVPQQLLDIAKVSDLLNLLGFVDNSLG